MVDFEIAADAAYLVGYTDLSTFDRALVDVRATRDQWEARAATPDGCTFSATRSSTLVRPDFFREPE